MLLHTVAGCLAYFFAVLMVRLAAALASGEGSSPSGGRKEIKLQSMYLFKHVTNTVTQLHKEQAQVPRGESLRTSDSRLTPPSKAGSDQN